MSWNVQNCSVGTETSFQIGHLTLPSAAFDSFLNSALSTPWHFHKCALYLVWHRSKRKECQTHPSSHWPYNIRLFWKIFYILPFFFDSNVFFVDLVAWSSDFCNLLAICTLKQAVARVFWRSIGLLETCFFIKWWNLRPDLSDIVNLYPEGSVMCLAMLCNVQICLF